MANERYVPGKYFIGYKLGFRLIQKQSGLQFTPY